MSASDIVEIGGCCAGVPARIADILDTQHITFGPVHLGDRAIIGAGAVVLQDVPPGCVAIGNPARVIRRVV